MSAPNPNSEEKVDWWKYEGQVISLDADIPETRLIKSLLRKGQIPEARPSTKPRGTLAKTKSQNAKRLKTVDKK